MLLAGLDGSSGTQSFSGNCSNIFTVPYNAPVTFTHFAIYSSAGNGNAGFTHRFVYATVNGTKINSSPIYVNAGDIISYSSGSTFNYNESLSGYEYIGNNPALMTYTGQKISNLSACLII